MFNLFSAVEFNLTNLNATENVVVELADSIFNINN